MDEGGSNDKTLQVQNSQLIGETPNLNDRDNSLLYGFSASNSQHRGIVPHLESLSVPIILPGVKKSTESDVEVLDNLSMEPNHKEKQKSTNKNISSHINFHDKAEKSDKSRDISPLGENYTSNDVVQSMPVGQSSMESVGKDSSASSMSGAISNVTGSDPDSVSSKIVDRGISEPNVNTSTKSPAQHRMFVGRISAQTTESSLQQYLESILRLGDASGEEIVEESSSKSGEPTGENSRTSRRSQIVDIYLPHDAAGRNRGFAFVSFQTSEALRIIAANGPHTIDGRRVVVDIAAPRGQRVDVPGSLDISRPTLGSSSVFTSSGSRGMPHSSPPHQAGGRQQYNHYQQHMHLPHYAMPPPPQTYVSGGATANGMHGHSIPFVYSSLEMQGRNRYISNPFAHFMQTQGYPFLQTQLQSQLQAQRAWAGLANPPMPSASPSQGQTTIQQNAPPQPASQTVRSDNAGSAVSLEAFGSTPASSELRDFGFGVSESQMDGSFPFSSANQNPSIQRGYPPSQSVTSQRSPVDSRSAGPVQEPQSLESSQRYSSFERPTKTPLPPPGDSPYGQGVHASALRPGEKPAAPVLPPPVPLYPPSGTKVVPESPAVESWGSTVGVKEPNTSQMHAPGPLPMNVPMGMGLPMNVGMPLHMNMNMNMNGPIGINPYQMGIPMGMGMGIGMGMPMQMQMGGMGYTPSPPLPNRDRDGDKDKDKEKEKERARSTADVKSATQGPSSQYNDEAKPAKSSFVTPPLPHGAPAAPQGLSGLNVSPNFSSFPELGLTSIGLGGLGGGIGSGLGMRSPVMLGSPWATGGFFSGVPSDSSPPLGNINSNGSGLQSLDFPPLESPSHLLNLNYGQLSGSNTGSWSPPPQQRPGGSPAASLGDGLAQGQGLGSSFGYGIGAGLGYGYGGAADGNQAAGIGMGMGLGFGVSGSSQSRRHRSRDSGHSFSFINCLLNSGASSGNSSPLVQSTNRQQQNHAQRQQSANKSHARHKSYDGGWRSQSVRKRRSLSQASLVQQRSDTESVRGSGLAEAVSLVGRSTEETLRTPLGGSFFMPSPVFRVTHRHGFSYGENSGLLGPMQGAGPTWDSQNTWPSGFSSSPGGTAAIRNSPKEEVQGEAERSLPGAEKANKDIAAIAAPVVTRNVSVASTDTTGSRRDTSEKGRNTQLFIQTGSE